MRSRARCGLARARRGGRAGCFRGRSGRPHHRLGAARPANPTEVMRCVARIHRHYAILTVFWKHGGNLMATLTMPSAEVVFDTLFAYQRSAALKSAIDLDVFTAIDDGDKTTSALATRCRASERGMRILCDYLATIGLLTKSDGTYHLTPESA